MKSNMTIIEDIEDYIKWIKSNELMSKEEKEDILGWIRREIIGFESVGKNRKSRDR